MNNPSSSSSVSKHERSSCVSGMLRVWLEYVSEKHM